MGKYLYRRAMIIDDSKLDHFISGIVIERNQFAEGIVNFTYAQDALAYLQSFRGDLDSLPDIIFLDIHMPVMDGFEFLGHYEQLPMDIQEHCTIIMISSTESQDDFARIRTYSSVRKFFSKPLSVNTLNDIRKNVGVKVFS